MRVINQLLFLSIYHIQSSAYFTSMLFNYNNRLERPSRSITADLINLGREDLLEKIFKKKKGMSRYLIIFLKQLSSVFSIMYYKFS